MASCRKVNEQNPVIVTGTISCTVHVKHHTWGVPAINVYIKRNASTFPGKDTARYDTFKTTDTQGMVTFDSLYPGNYFLYSQGYDPIWGDTVIGYQPLVLNDNSVTNNNSTFVLYVSE